MSQQPESSTPSEPAVQHDVDDSEPQAGSNFDFFDPNSPLAKYYFRASHVLATLFLVLLFVFFNLTPLAHSDVWGHLKYGEWILENGRLPDRELFSPYSDPNVTAQNFQWLSQLIFCESFRFGAWLAGGSPLHQLEGGVDVLRAVHALCETLKALFLLLAFRRLANSVPWAIAGVFVVFAFSLFSSSVQRPQAFAEPLFAALLWLLARRGAGFPTCPLDGDETPADGFGWKQIAAIAAIMVVWANVHGSFLIGLALVGLCWLGRVVDVARERGLGAVVRDPSVQRLFVAGLLGTIALSILNPHGVRAIPDILTFAKSPNVQTMREWRPLEFSHGPGGHWGYGILLGLVILTQAVSPRVYAPTQLLLLTVFGLGPLLQERLMTWWVMLVPAIVLPVWADLGRLPPALAERWTSVLSLRKTIVAAGIVLVGLVWSNVVQLLLGHPPMPIGNSVRSQTLWPITAELLQGKPPASTSDAKTFAANPLTKAMTKGLKSYPDGAFRGAIFVPESMGDYLVWSLGSDGSRAPVLVYSHVHWFPTEHWNDYMVVLMGRPGWQKALDRHRVNLVVAPIDERGKLYEQIKGDPNWSLVLDPDDAGLKTNLFAALRKVPLEAAR